MIYWVPFLAGKGGEGGEGGCHYCPGSDYLLKDDALLCVSKSGWSIIRKALKTEPDLFLRGKGDGDKGRLWYCYFGFSCSPELYIRIKLS